MSMRHLRSITARVLATGLAVAVAAVALSGTGIATAAHRAIHNMVDGHPLSAKPKPNGVLLLGRNRKFPAKAIPTVDRAKRANTATSAKSAKTAKTATNAKALGGQSLTKLMGACPDGTADIGTWCVMTNPYPLATAQQGLNNYFYATQACAAIGGFLPTAGQLIGAAGKVKLESTIDDNPSTATVQGGDGQAGPQLDQREMTDTLVTTQAGSDAAGSEGVTPGAHPDPTSGQPDPTPQPAVPSPSTLQYVTVYSNHTNGGFAGSEPVGAPENFRCGFDLKQSAKAPKSSAQAQVLRRSMARRTTSAPAASAAHRSSR